MLYEVITLIREAGPASPSVLFVGRLARRKGCRWFIENVLPRLSEQFRFVVAGTPWDAEETAALDNERVTFLGPIRGEALAPGWPGAGSPGRARLV